MTKHSIFCRAMHPTIYVLVTFVIKVRKKKERENASHIKATIYLYREELLCRLMLLLTWYQFQYIALLASYHTLAYNFINRVLILMYNSMIVL